MTPGQDANGARHDRTSAERAAANRRQSGPVTARTISGDALRVALKLAGGDRSRLRFEADGTVTVANTPRLGHPTN